MAQGVPSTAAHETTQQQPDPSTWGEPAGDKALTSACLRSSGTLLWGPALPSWARFSGLPIRGMQRMTDY